MKYIELKDLEQGANIVLAWKDDEGKWWPHEVEVHKEKGIKFYDIDKCIPIPLMEFFKSFKGMDKYQNKIFEVAVFDSINECQNWCDRENKFNETYFLKTC